MVEFFGRKFNNLPDEFNENLQKLEDEGSIYAEFWNQEREKFVFCRIQFEPNEIVQFVDSLSGYDEFLNFKEKGYSSEVALDMISDRRIKSCVKSYNQLAKDDNYSNQVFCPASFFLGELEDLVCGGKKPRYEFLQESYTSDRRFLLTEIIEGLPESFSILQNRNESRPDYEITCEKDIQDLFYAIIKPIFPDSRPEEYTPKHATTSKRIDFVIPKISTLIEIKYVRDKRHAKTIGDELRVDIESYYIHSDCKKLIAKN